jgi:hypothetical protein
MHTQAHSERKTMTLDEQFEHDLSLQALLQWVAQYAPFKKPMPKFAPPKAHLTPFAIEWAKRFPNQRS